MAFYITKNNDLYGSGTNYYGMLGTGDEISVTDTIVQVSGIKARQVSSSTYHSLVLPPIGQDGMIYGCGNNEYKQVSQSNASTKILTFQPLTGFPVSADDVVQILAFEYMSAALTKDGDVYLWGRDHSYYSDTGYTKIATPEKIKYVCLAPGAMFVVGESGKAYCKGYNGNGELGVGDRLEKTDFTEITTLVGVKQVTAGYGHTVFVLQNGDVYGAGSTSGGALGLGTSYTSYIIPTKLPISNVKEAVASACEFPTTEFILNDGSVYRCGRYRNDSNTANNDIGTPTKIDYLSNIVHATAYPSNTPGQSAMLYLNNVNNVYGLGNRIEFGLDSAPVPVNIVTPYCFDYTVTALKSNILDIANDYIYTATSTTYNIPTGFLMYIDPVETYTNGSDITITLTVRTDGNHSNPDNLIKYKVSKVESTFVDPSQTPIEIIPFQSTYQFYDKITFTIPIEHCYRRITMDVESQSGNNKLSMAFYDRRLALFIDNLGYII